MIFFEHSGCSGQVLVELGREFSNFSSQAKGPANRLSRGVYPARASTGTTPDSGLSGRWSARMRKKPGRRCVGSGQGCS